MSDNKVFDSKRLTKLRGNMPKVQLAELAGISDSTLVNLESGKNNPSQSTITKLAAALGVSVDRLYKPSSNGAVDSAKKSHAAIIKNPPTKPELEIPTATPVVNQETVEDWNDDAHREADFKTDGVMSGNFVSESSKDFISRTMTKQKSWTVIDSLSNGDLLVKYGDEFYRATLNKL